MSPLPDPKHVSDLVVLALAALEVEMRRVAEVGDRIVERADYIKRLRADGKSYSEIVPTEERPLIVEMLSSNLERLSDVGSKLRRAEAQALYDEGMTMAQIAKLFGVTRQRIAVLVRSPRPDDPDARAFEATDDDFEAADDD